MDIVALREAAMIAAFKAKIPVPLLSALGELIDSATEGDVLRASIIHAVMTGPNLSGFIQGAEQEGGVIPAHFRGDLERLLNLMKLEVSAIEHLLSFRDHPDAQQEDPQR